MRCLLAVAVFLVLVSPGEAVAAVGERLEVKINTIGLPELWFTITLRDSIDFAKTHQRYRETNEPAFDLRDLATGQLISELGLGGKDDAIDLIATDPDASVAKMIFKGEVQVYIASSGDLPLFFQDGETGALTPAELKELSSQIGLEEGQVRALELVGRGQQRVLDNDISFSQHVGDEDSTRTEYVLNFQLGQPIGKTPLVFETKGRISTDEEHPLNQVELSLVGRTNPSQDEFGIRGLTWSGYLECAVLGNQTLDASGMRVSLGVEGLFPNFINLTGGANRLRLFPVMGVGVGYRRNFEDVAVFGEGREFLELLFNISYVIPVLGKYTLYLDGEATFNDDRVGDNWRHLSSITLAYDLPLEELRILASWETGSNEFTFEDDSRVLIGLLASYLPM